MGPLELVKINHLMERTAGRAEIKVALIDGPVAIDHADLAGRNIREVGGPQAGACSKADSLACLHGTFVAGMLCAKRGSNAPAICPECTLVVRPVFSEEGFAQRDMPQAKPEEIARAIVETVSQGARVINLSAAFTWPTSNGERTLQEALDYAAKWEVMFVAAAGNQGSIGSSILTRHPLTASHRHLEGQAPPPRL
jgi:subtilisin family serine protease